MPGEVARSRHIHRRQHRAEPLPATSSHLPRPSQGKGSLEVPHFQSGQRQVPSSEGRRRCGGTQLLARLALAAAQ